MRATAARSFKRVTGEGELELASSGLYAAIGICPFFTESQGLMSKDLSTQSVGEDAANSTTDDEIELRRQESDVEEDDNDDPQRPRGIREFMDWLRLSLVALAFAGESECDLVSSTRSDTGMIGRVVVQI
jgi:hypothetical protein